MHLKSHALKFALVTALSVLTACSAEKPSHSEASAPDVKADAGELNLYSSRHYDTDLRLYSDFEAQTGIKINRIEAKSNALIERIKSEGEFSPADLLVTVDAGVFWRAEEAGILQPISSNTLEQRIPPQFRHPEGLWHGLSKRARVIIYNKSKGKPSGLNSYADLADPAHRGKICMRSSGNIYNISLLASMIAHDGASAAQSWAKGVSDNFARKPQSNDSGQIEAVAASICEISVVNSYYLARYARSDEAQKKDIFNALGIIFPNQATRGTHVNISGAALTAHAPNPENALKFLEYLTTEKAQSYFADGNNEYPVIQSQTASAALQSLGTFKEDQINVAHFGKNQAEAIRIYDAVSWP